MGRLTDILGGGGNDDHIRRLWNETEAAGDFVPLPKGGYVARIVRGELESSRTKSTPGYKLEFAVIEGAFAGRKFWHDVWLTPAALPMAKRDLAKLGIASLDDLERPFPQGIVCKVKLALRREDDGSERNRVVAFDVIRIEAPQVDPFAPEGQGGDAV